LPRAAEQLLYLGTQAYSPAERGRLAAANVAGYLATISSLGYAISYAIQDYATLIDLVYGNLISAAITASLPFFHRFGSAAAGLVLTATVFTTIFYFISELGHGSGIQLNYLAAAALAVLILGLRRLKLVIAIIATAAALHLAAWFMYPKGAHTAELPAWFLAQTYVLSTLTATIIIALIVFYAFHLVSREQARSDTLLLNILPAPIAERLKAEPETTIAERCDAVSVLFCDLCGFTPLTSRLAPDDLIALLDDLFSAFDAEAARLGVEKIKTIGDAYMVVAGLPEHRPDHAAAAAGLAQAMHRTTSRIADETGHSLTVRIGIATGSVTAGVIGRSKFAYDVWGETVNRAARLEAAGEPGGIFIDEQTATALNGRFEISALGPVDLKGIGATNVWTLHA
jgi:class 3 adenylate cyclase